MKKLFSTLLFVLAAYISIAQQRVVAECTVVYGITVDENSSNAEAVASLKQSSKTVYVKGINSRTDLISPSFSQSVIYQKTTGTAVILREFGANKFMTKLDQAKWVSENAKYVDMKLIKTDETKVILGYECKKALLELKDGTSLTIFYATNIVPSVKEFEYQFKDIPGFVLEYESSETEGKKIRYTATKINLNPVAAAKFDIPTSGYRLLD